MKFSRIVVCPARFQELFDTKVVPDAAFLREVCPLFEILGAHEPLPAPIADDPTAFAFVRGKDELGAPALEAFSFVEGAVSHYRVPNVSNAGEASRSAAAAYSS